MQTRFHRKDLGAILFLLPIVMIGMSGALVILISPLMIGGLVDTLGLKGRDVGLIFGAEMAGMTVAVFAASVCVQRWNRQYLAMFAACLMLIGNVGSVPAESFLYCLGIRFIAGLGEGGLVAIMSAAIATTNKPERNFSIFLLSHLGNGFIWLSLLPAVIDTYGVDSVFWLLSGFAVLGFLLARGVPAYALEVETVDIAGNPAHNNKKGILGLAATLFLYIGLGALWPYMERIGVAAQFPTVYIHQALAGGTLAAIAGALAAILLNVRLGRTFPLLAGNLGLLICAGTLYFFMNTKTFFVVVWTYMFFWIFTTPYLIGVLAALDPRGRLVVISIAMQNAGLFLGPVLAAMLVSDTNYLPICWLSMLCFALCLITILPALSSKTAAISVQA